MNLVPFADLELEYVDLERVPLEAGARFYGHMNGRLSGGRISGSLRLTNLATGRPDGVNEPALRGLLTTSDDVDVWVAFDGIATLREEDAARVFVTSMTMRCADDRYTWVNSVFCLVEGVLDTGTNMATGRIVECRATLEAPEVERMRPEEAAHEVL